MARLTNITYLDQRRKLRAEWLSSGGGAFVMLSSLEQWTLHEYYRFADDLSDEEALAHRRAISSESQLPQRAGKAIAQIAFFSRRLEVYLATPHPKRKKGAPYEVRVFGMVNPNLDPDAMARILIRLAKERAKR